MRVSIIVGAHNEEKTISGMIDSVLAQSYVDYELLICDDASTDNTLMILREYEFRYPSCIRILHNEKNLSLAGTLNRCLLEANGEYIARIDADDRMKPDRLQKQVEYLDAHSNCMILGSSVEVRTGHGTFIRSINPDPVLKDLIKGGYAFWHPTIMFRKGFIEDLGGYNNTQRCLRCEDLDLWYRALQTDYRFHNLFEPLTVYTENDSDFKKRSFENAQTVYRLRRHYRKKCRYFFVYDMCYWKSLLFAMMPSGFRSAVKHKHVKGQ